MESLQDLIIPVETSNNVMVMVGIFGFLAVLWIIWRSVIQKKSPKKMALNKLKKLHKALKNDKQKPPQSTAQSVSRILREGLEVQNLATVKTQNSEDWHLFRKELESASYEKGPLSQSKCEALFKQAQQWLKQ